MRKQNKMGLFDKLKNVLGKKEEPKKTKRVKKEKAPEPVLSEKERATAAGEPYIQILKMDVDPNNINSGSFDLDFNEIFVARLVKAGYMMKKEDKDTDIVDRWFQTVCRNVALEVYEQQQADLTNRDVRPVYTRDLGDGRTEVS